MTEKTSKPSVSTFETSLKRLEQLVTEMEGGDLSLDQMIQHFEEGTELVDQCGKRLNEVEQRIEKLVKKEGKITSEPFDPPSEK
jgi:exodeoxyribonuclease VII small subunit